MRKGGFKKRSCCAAKFQINQKMVNWLLASKGWFLTRHKIARTPPLLAIIGRMGLKNKGLFAALRGRQVDHEIVGVGEVQNLAGLFVKHVAVDGLAR